MQEIQKFEGDQLFLFFQSELHMRLRPTDEGRKLVPNICSVNNRLSPELYRKSSMSHHWSCTIYYCSIGPFIRSILMGWVSWASFWLYPFLKQEPVQCYEHSSIFILEWFHSTIRSSFQPFHISFKLLGNNHFSLDWYSSEESGK